MPAVGPDGFVPNGDGEDLRQAGLVPAQRISSVVAVDVPVVPQRNPPRFATATASATETASGEYGTPTRDGDLLRRLVPEVVHEEDVTGGVTNHPVDRIPEHPRSKPERFAFRDDGLDSAVGGEVDDRVLRVVAHDFVRFDVGVEVVLGADETPPMGPP